MPECDERTDGFAVAYTALAKGALQKLQSRTVLTQLKQQGVSYIHLHVITIQGVRLSAGVHSVALLANGFSNVIVVQLGPLLQNSRLQLIDVCDLSLVDDFFL